MTIEELVQIALHTPNHKQIKVSLGKLSEEEIAKIAQETGFDLTDFERIIDNYAIKHINKKHGNEKKEASRGQVAIDEADYQQIAALIDKSSVEYSGKNDIGNDTLMHVAELDWLYFYVEEIRTGKKQLAGQTLYKRKIR